MHMEPTWLLSFTAARKLSRTCMSSVEELLTRNSRARPKSDTCTVRRSSAARGRSFDGLCHPSNCRQRE